MPYQVTIWSRGWCGQLIARASYSERTELWDMLRIQPSCEYHAGAVRRCKAEEMWRRTSETRCFEVAVPETEALCGLGPALDEQVAPVQVPVLKLAGLLRHRQGERHLRAVLGFRVEGLGSAGKHCALASASGL